MMPAFVSDRKPSIFAVVSQYVRLRRAGKSYTGLCPFHADKTPSLSVNDEKGLFHCFGCGASGDVISFLQKIEGLTFPEACSALGIDSERRPQPALTSSRKRAAQRAAAWVNSQRAKFNILIAAALERCDLADQIGDFELAEIFDRELVLLHGFYDSLEHPRCAVEMLAMRESVERITEGTASAL